MRIVHVNTHEQGGGAARIAMLLHRSLRNTGRDSLLLVRRRGAGSKDPFVAEYARWSPAMLDLLRARLDVCPLMLYRRKTVMHWSCGIAPSRVSRSVHALSPDIVHLHWIGHAFLSLRDVAHLPDPLVWTLHDSWAFTGGCHVPLGCTLFLEGCGRCPLLGSTSRRDVSAFVWRRKHRLWGNLPVTIVTPSEWLAQRVLLSPIFLGKPVKVIPNGVDTDVFYPEPQADARQVLDWQLAKYVILFGAMHATQDHNKGWHLLRQALGRACEKESFRSSVELVVYGNDGTLDPQLPMRVRLMGQVRDDSLLRRIYSAADVMVIPSLQENFPNTALESMACATPVVAFRQGGMAEIVRHNESGYLADPYVVEDLARGLLAVLDQNTRERWAACSLRIVQQGLTAGHMVRSYQSLYQQMLCSRRNNLPR